MLLYVRCYSWGGVTLGVMLLSGRCYSMCDVTLWLRESLGVGDAHITPDRHEALVCAVVLSLTNGFRVKAP